MALKENIEAVKKEIGAEEQFLEGVIKSERFFKKYKKTIISAVAVAVIGMVGYATMTAMEENRLEVSNMAYNKLLKDPNNTEALSVLKDKNERLYNFYRFQQAIEKNDKAVLEELAQYKKDPVISDLATYQLNGTKSELLSGFIALQDGYKLMKEDKVKEAKLKFAQIDLNSPLKNISNNLEHYQGIKSRGSN